MISIRKMISNLILSGCAAAGLAFAAPIAVSAAPACPPLESRTLTSTNAVLTTSMAPVNVPGTLINFDQGGTKAGCVLVSFSAEASADALRVMSVQPMLDNVTACSPSFVQFVRGGNSPTALESRAMNFSCPATAPGSHSIRMQYVTSGGTVSLGIRTITVQYVP